MKLLKSKKQDLNNSYINQRRHILGKNSNFYIKEAYKTLRTNIRFGLSGEGCKKFAITSGLAGEGKSITILNLAISFAETGKGFANYLIVLGVVETCAIFALVFSFMAMP